MKRVLLSIVFISIASLCFAQKTYQTTDFSDKYYAKVYIEQPDKVFSPGWIAIYDKKTNEELIRVESEELAASYNSDGKITTNVVEMPYGEQSLVICSDFDCDGVDDLAIQEGQNSCYHGPSYNVYISENGKLVYNETFSELAQMYCGFPAINCESKTISTMTKSGCCWHQFREYNIVAGKPVLAKEIVEDAFFPLFVKTSITTWDSNGLEKKYEETNSLNIADEDILFSFEIAKNKKRVDVFKYDDKLHYCFSNADGNVEFHYPDIDPDNDQDRFYITSNGATDLLSFTNASAKYTIYNSSTKVGIKVEIASKVYDMPGILSSRKGTFSNIREANAGNTEL